jgi:transposase-like protein
MNMHSNARLTPRSRAEMIQRILSLHQPLAVVASSCGVSERTLYKRLARFRAEGAAGLRDRSSRPRKSPRQIPAAQTAAVLSLRRLRTPGFQIAQQTALSKASVSRILRRHGLNRLSSLEPAPVVRHYEKEHPGELLHVDIKKLVRIERPSHRVTGYRRDMVRGAGYEYVHVAIDDCSRIAFARVMPNEKKEERNRFSSFRPFLLPLPGH